MPVRKKPTLLRRKEVCARVAVEPLKLMRMVKAGDFPTPIDIGAGRGKGYRWIESEVNAWLAAKIAERDAAKNAPRKTGA